jgi:hypothetical protein
MHAILGASEHCIALHASDLCVPLVALDAVAHIQGADAQRRVPLTEFYVVPGDRPDVETVLRHGEMLTAMEVPLPPPGTRSGYLKVRDRASYEFALTSAAVALAIDDGVISDARVALGGVGTIPWRAPQAEAVLRGAPVGARVFRAAADAAIHDPFTVPGTAFKVELAKRTLVRVLETVTGGQRMRTTVAAPAALVGPGVDRVDGRLKVMGAAHYPSDFSLPDMANAALVRSTIAAGTIARLDTARAAAAPGVLAVITHQNAGRLHKGKRNLVYPPPPPPLQDPKISYYGQYVAMVVAETRQQAAAAARLVEVSYDRDEPVLSLEDEAAKPKSNPYFIDIKRGNVTAAMAAAEVTVEGTFTTPAQTHNPLGPFTTVAHWDGDTLTVYDSTQNPFLVRAVLAASFGIAEEKVRVLTPFVGGAFGAGLRSWPHSILAALAARTVNRPVQLTLTRPEMFTGIGRRPSTVQHLKVAATRDGELVAIDHEATSTASMHSDSPYPITAATTAAYACPNVTAHDKRVRLNIPPIAHMRAPALAEGNFALESLLDELSYQLGMDPIELRLRNYAAVHPQTGLPWSSKALRECYQAGAERFGWAQREPAVGAMRDGRWLVGYGMARGDLPQLPGQMPRAGDDPP